VKIFKIIFILVVYSTILFSQSSSTYTRNGIGDLNYTYSARSLGLAQSGSAMLNDNYVELINPASWSKLRLTRIEFSLVLNGVELSDNSNTVHITQMPILKVSHLLFPSVQNMELVLLQGYCHTAE